MLANKIMKESLARDAEYWNFIGKLLVELQKNDVISTDVLQNVCSRITFREFVYSLENLSLEKLAGSSSIFLPVCRF